MTTLTTDEATISVPSFMTYHNLGSLAPTYFPANCLTDWWDMQTQGLGMPRTWTYHTQGCATSTCCPFGKFYTEGWAWMTSYYSPGVCPSQYKSCVPPSAPTALSSAPGETIAFCCPTSKFSDICRPLLSLVSRVLNLLIDYSVPMRPAIFNSV